LAKERRRRRRDRKDGTKKLELELSKKIAAIVSEGTAPAETEEEKSSPDMSEKENEAVVEGVSDKAGTQAAEKAAQSPQEGRDEAKEEAASRQNSNEQQAEDATFEQGAEPGGEGQSLSPKSSSQVQQRRKRTIPPKAPADAVEIDDKKTEGSEAKVVRLPERKPRKTGEPQIRPRPKRRRADRRAPGSPASDFSDTSSLEAQLIGRKKKIAIAKLGTVALVALFFGWFGNEMVTSRGLYNQRVDAARTIRDKVNEVFSTLDKIRRIFDRKKTAKKRFTRDLRDLALKKGPDNISKKFVKDLGEIERRLKLMHPQTVGDIIDFHSTLIELTEAIKEHVQALDQDDWNLLLKYADPSKKIPVTMTALVIKPPPPKPGLDIVLEKGEPVIIQEIVRKHRGRIYKVHKVGKELPVYELSPDQLQIAKLGDYIEDPLHQAIDKYQKSESKITSLLQELMKSRSSLLGIIQKYANEEKLSEF